MAPLSYQHDIEFRVVDHVVISALLLKLIHLYEPSYVVQLSAALLEVNV